MRVARPSAARIPAVFWDVGNVLLRWDIRELFGKLFDDPDEMHHFLTEIWTPKHNLRCDSGESFAVVIEEVVSEHPHYEAEVRAVRERWIETVPGPVAGMEQLVSDLDDRGVPQYGITNFSAETFPLVAHYPHLRLLQDIVVSGHVGFTKPDPAIYQVALSRAGIPAELAVFVDDSVANVDGAEAVGMAGIVFLDATQTRRDLAAAGVESSSTAS